MNKPTMLDRFFHVFGAHKYQRIMKMSDHSHLLKCAICKKYFAMNTSARVLVPWDQELEDFHVSMGNIIVKENGGYEKGKRNT